MNFLHIWKGDNFSRQNLISSESVEPVPLPILNRHYQAEPRLNESSPYSVTFDCIECYFTESFEARLGKLRTQFSQNVVFHGAPKENLFLSKYKRDFS